jgi:hypothetical protein
VHYLWWCQSGGGSERNSKFSLNATSYSVFSDQFCLMASGVLRWRHSFLVLDQGYRFVRAELVWFVCAFSLLAWIWIFGWVGCS